MFDIQENQDAATCIHTYKYRYYFGFIDDLWATASTSIPWIPNIVPNGQPIVIWPRGLLLNTLSSCHEVVECGKV